MFANLKKILVPVDFSEPSHAALLLACDVARNYDVELTLFNVYQIPGFVYPEGFMPAWPEIMADLVTRTQGALSELKQIAENAGARKVSLKASEGAPFGEILAEAESGNYDLIVMGTHGNTGIKHAFLGSVAENVVRRAKCPVLTLRPPKPDKRQAVPEEARSP